MRANAMKCKQFLHKNNEHQYKSMDSQKKTSGDFRKLLQERIYKTNPRPKSLTKEEKTKLIKLEAMATNLRCGENVRSDG